MIFRIFVFLVAWGLAFASPAQNLSHIIGITQDGVYKISKSQAQQLGFQGLTNLSIYGYPGPLPQVLDSAQLALQEIPSWQGGDDLYFFLKFKEILLMRLLPPIFHQFYLLFFSS